MRALIQRVTEASVSVEGQIIGQIDAGLLVLVCAMAGDAPDAPEKLARKIAKLRIFQDAAGKTNRSVQDVGGSLLVVSQFTLAADTSRGNRPGFSAAAPPEDGRAAYEAFCTALTQLGLPVETGSFGADMKVSLVNDGPMTIWMEL